MRIFNLMLKKEVFCKEGVSVFVMMIGGIVGKMFIMFILLFVMFVYLYI